ncbi:MAG TPA: nucleoside-diphosphate sugar epimerase/dehydratase [Usitatibacteraceae bacterium]|nr:nucleoside-diphosphate sugar epimerase/dehydratase [Usitatibacteraceae bacterium]
MKPFQMDSHALVALAHDAVALTLSWAFAFSLLGIRGDQGVPGEVTVALLVAIPLQGLVSYLFGVYQGIWRYTSLPDVQRIVFSVLAGTVAVAILLNATGFGEALSYREYALYPLILVSIMSGSRMAVRSFKEWSLYGRSAEHIPVIVLGAGDAAVGLLKELSRSQEWRVVGLLDDDMQKRGRLLQGVRVMGPLDELPRLATRLKVRHAIIAMPSVPYKVRRRVVEVCKRAKVTVLTVPSLDNVAGGKLAAPKIRKVAVEDLMKREPVTLDDAGLHDLLTGKVVLVTGAGGSIGSELCRQIAAFQPSMLVLFEQNEYGMYRVDGELRDGFPEMPVASVVGDVTNARRVAQAMHQYSPSIVFHAAAYKHVPLMEELNSWEAVRNNVYGTYVVARAAIDYGVKKFVFVSTDKAVNPTNVMGATKRLAEMVCQVLQAGSATRFEMVRFGNVLGSAGSVIPRFEEQIQRGGPVTVTHPEMVRYFMSIPEAAQLVLQAGCMGLGGEIFVMDMGEPVKIVDLARDMIRLSDLSEEEIKIVYTGLRPGEKLFEELLADDEHTRPTPHPKLRVAKAREAEPGAWLEELLVWLTQDRVSADAEVRRDLKRWVPEFQSQVRPRLKAVPGTRAA